jgi:hypothetical protein
MLKKLEITFSLLLIVFVAFSQNKGVNDRQLWLKQLDKLARPVMMHLAEDRLKERMPVEVAKTAGDVAGRTAVSYLEAFGRTLSGIGPWLNLEGGSNEEVALRNQYRQWALKAMANAVNPGAKDYLKWNGGQPLVDASFVAFGLVRCPWLWQNLDTVVRKQVVAAFKVTRGTVPAFNNWVLFSGMVEAFFLKYGLDYDPVRIEFAVRQFSNHWYVGDGFFSDGTGFHMDYYNSIVIHPYLASIVEIANGKNRSYQSFVPNLLKINKRYAEIQERNINADGTYPVTGRSIVYRGGVFHHLADMGLRKQLPESLKPAQVRSALTAVVKKTLEAPNSYNAAGWLTIGLFGSQPDLADSYITTGSLYICATVFLPLGLPQTDEFWSAPAVPWTSVKVWSGQNVQADHAVDIRL